VLPSLQSRPPGISSTKAMNKRYDDVGALFQGAFQAKHITGVLFGED
jgi:hypothetical protein